MLCLLGKELKLCWIPFLMGCGEFEDFLDLRYRNWCFKRYFGDVK